MNEFLAIMAKDILKEKFTKKECIVYGVVAPLMLIAACITAEAVINI